MGVDVPPVTPDDRRTREHARVAEVADGFDLDRLRARDPAEARELLGVGARPPADDDHQVDLAGRLERVLLAPDGHRADRVHDLELVAPRDHERRELLELPGRLGRLRDQRHLLLARDLVPVLFLVDDDRVRREPQEADHLGMLGRAEEHDRVALLDELHDLLLLLDDPGAGAVDDLEAAGRGAVHHVGANAVGADHDGRAVVDVVERVDGLDPELLEVADHALVVDDLAEGVRRLARGAGLLGHVDRLANAVAEARPLRDLDLGDRADSCAHVGTSIPRPPGWTRFSDALPARCNRTATPLLDAFAAVRKPTAAWRTRT